MDRATAAWSRSLAEPPDWAAPFILKISRHYVLYGPMALLPSTAYDALAHHNIPPAALAPALLALYTLITHHLKITHIACTRPIPAQDSAHGTETKNILRAPRNFTPLFGDFGPATCANPPSREDFAAAFWVTAKQNGVYQTWAPRWTMFSRGNVSEKARLVGLGSVGAVVEEGRGGGGRGSCAVDLYAGVGYFAFSFLRAGVGRVVCWDLSGWSCEGLVRGAGANGWGVRFVAGGEDFGEGLGDDEGVRVVVFNESNVHAPRRVREARGALPPIRHVNCGLLPSSRASRGVAVEVLDPSAGGWIHVHENFAVGEIAHRAEEVRREVQLLVDFQQGEQERDVQARVVELEHVNRLKSYAPGVMHCVLDIYIPPSAPLY
ncbi:hypothetical protein LTR08_005377 [Meristemomyces frigidus]|nr:hypothetical protein LTR08_005377 [Meristemomyces frigidus]